MSDELTLLDVESIRKFVLSVEAEGYLGGAVLDYGSGRQPHRDIIEAAGGEYVPFDSPSFPCSIASTDTTELARGRKFDAVLCSGVLQFVDDVPEFLRHLRTWLYPDGVLVLSYTTNWPEVNHEDLHRFTRTGMDGLLIDAGWTVLRHERRATIHAHGYEWALGYGVVAA